MPQQGKIENQNFSRLARRRPLGMVFQKAVGGLAPAQGHAPPAGHQIAPAFPGHGFAPGKGQGRLVGKLRPGQGIQRHGQGMGGLQPAAPGLGQDQPRLHHPHAGKIRRIFRQI